MKMYRHEAEKASRMDLLEQSKWWRTSDGETVKLKQMDPNHLANLRDWLVRNAAFFARAKMMAAIRASLQVEAHHGWDVPDGVYAAMHHWEGAAQDAVDYPEDWMRQRPLFRRLVELT